MLNLDQIEAAILTLSLDEFQRLRQWVLDVDYQRWDEQLEQDISDRITRNTIAFHLLCDFINLDFFENLLPTV
jgi:hypothetical protein